MVIFFNKIFSDWTFDESWHDTILQMLSKDGHLKKLSNWPPIAVLPIFYKVFAKLIYGKKSLVLTFFYLSVIIGAILGLRGANSTQGFLLIVLGFAIVIYFYVKFKFRSRILSRVVLFGSFAGIV